jgi:hypothetical protein
MEFNATKETTKLKLLSCIKCKGDGYLASIPVYDAPGDCTPIIESYTYGVLCQHCHIGTLRYDHPDVAAKTWNAFMS